MQGSDSFGLRLVSGQLLFSYDLGSGRADIRSNESYNDGNLHTVCSSYIIGGMLNFGVSLIV